MTTQDIDTVIAPTPEGLDRLLACFPDSKYYVSAETAHEALSKKTQFNVIDIWRWIRELALEVEWRKAKKIADA